MANPLMMRNNAKKRGSTIFLVAIFIALGIATAILAIAAFPTQSFFGSVSILYKAVGINGEVSATWKVGSEVNSMKTPTGETSVLFGYEKIENGSLSPLDENNNEKEIKLDRVNDFVEFTYTFKNYGSSAYTVMLDFTEYTNENIGITYKYNTNAYGPTEYGLVVKGVTASSPKNAQGKQYEESTYNIKLKVQDIALNASFISDFNWTMETYETTGNEELINLTNLTYTENTGDAAGTYSASYNGSALTNNTLYYPSQFGSAKVTTIKPGTANLPANTNVIIAEGIEEIADAAFGNQTNLKSVTFNQSNGASEISAQSSVKGLKKIGVSAFYGCKNLTEITIPATLTEVGAYAFSTCSNLNNVKFEDGSVLTYIGEDMFSACSNLTEITIPSSVTKINRGAFSACSNLEEANFNEGLLEISKLAFANCNKLTNVTLPESLTTLGEEAFLYSGIKEFYVPKNVVNLSKQCFGYINNVVFAEDSNLTIIPSNTFSGSGLKNIILPDSVVEIGSEAFSQSSLTNINFSKNLQKINGRAFQYCYLTEVILPEGLLTIGYQAFIQCSSIKTVTIPSSVTYIGDGAFNRCTAVEELNYNANTTNTYSAESSPFYKFGKVSKSVVWIGDNVTNLPEYLFVEANITNMYIPQTTIIDSIYHTFEETTAGFECCYTGDTFYTTSGYRPIKTIVRTREEYRAALENPEVEAYNRTWAYLETALMYPSNTIKILRDLTISKSLIIDQSTTTITADKDVTITCTVDNSFYIWNNVIIGEAGGSNITFKASGMSGYVFNVCNGTLTLNSAIIDGNNMAKGVVTGAGCVVYVQMNGGEIKNCVSTSASALSIGTDCVFMMTGGKIYNNTGSISSITDDITGAIVLSGSGMQMSGGEIYNNTITNKSGSGQAYGGGIFICDGATLTMTGGTFRNNKVNADYGFGANVHVGKNSVFNFQGGSIEGDGTKMARLGGGVSNIGTFTMTGGSILNCGAEIGGGVMNIGTATITGGTISGCAATNNASNVGKAIANNGVLNLGNVTLASGQDIAMGYQKVSLASSVLPEGYGSLNVTENLTSTYTITFIQVTGILSANVEAGSKAKSHFTGGAVFATYLNGATADASDFTTSGNTFYVNNGNVYMR